MVIQRLQTLFLILAIACMAVFLFVPFGYWDVDVMSNTNFVDLKAINFAAFLVPVCVSLLIMLIAIFCFKKMPLQKSLVALSAIIVLAIAGVVIYEMTLGFNDMVPGVTVKPVWGASGLLLVGAFVALIAAYRCISRDQKLLRSYDRLR